MSSGRATACAMENSQDRTTRDVLETAPRCVTSTRHRSAPSDRLGSRTKPAASLAPLAGTSRERAAGAGRQSTKLPPFGLLAALSYIIALSLLATGIGDVPSTILGFVGVPIALVITVPLLRRAASVSDFDLFGIAILGLGLRFVGSFFRFSGAADAAAYQRAGTELAGSFRRFDFFVDTEGSVPGTGSVRYLTGLAHLVTFDDMFSTFVVFTLFSFIGSLLFYLAFSKAVPDGDRRRYALLIFLWPSMVYWPSSIGKESWMVLGLGIASLGVAHIMTGQGLRGGSLLLVGLVVMTFVRPHVALMLMVAFATATVLGRSPTTKSRLTGLLVLALILVVAGGFVTRFTAERLNVDDLGSSSIDSALGSTENQTTQGGSSFKAATVKSPLDYPPALVTVLFRPFPQEAKSVEAFITSAEGILMAGLFVASWRRLLQIPALIRRRPYIAYALIMILVFVFAFSAIGNFGILARQRTQVLPFVLVLLALPQVTRQAPQARPSFSPDRRSPSPAG